MDLINSSDFDIRYTEVGDLDSLRSWLKTDAVLQWFPPMEDEELENFARIWVGFARYFAALTATYKKEPVGMAVLFLMPYRKVAHHTMFQILVAPDFQRKGIGRSLMKNLMHLAKTNFKQELIHGEILGEGPLIPLLKSLGFTEFARQEKYLKQKGKYRARILMEHYL